MDINDIINAIKYYYPTQSEIKDLDDISSHQKYLEIKKIAEIAKAKKNWYEIVEKISNIFFAHNTYEWNTSILDPSYSICVALNENTIDVKNIIICFSFLVPYYSIYFSRVTLDINGKYVTKFIEYEISNTEYGVYESEIRGIVTHFTNYHYLESKISQIQVDENLYLENFFQNGSPTIFDFIYTPYRV